MEVRKMIVFMSLDEYATYQNLVTSGVDADLAFQQLIRWSPADLQVETQTEPGDISEQPESEQTEQPEETKIE